jgi:hypothetical protein
VLLVIAVVVGLVTAATACGGNDTAHPAAATNACDLLTNAEAASILGVPVDLQDDTDRGIPGSACAWLDSAHADLANEGVDVYSLAIDEARDSARRKEFDHDRRRRDARAVPGLGDAAYFLPRDTAPSLELRVGEHVVSIVASSDEDGFHSLSTAQVEALERSAAALVVPRLTKAG